jgi:hypothetical protein
VRLFAPARRRHTHQCLEGNGKRGLKAARQRAAVGGENTAADTGMVRQPRYAGGAAARRETAFEYVWIASIRSLPEDENRSDSAKRAER